MCMERIRWRVLLLYLCWGAPLLGLFVWVALDWETQPLRCPIKYLMGIPCVGCGALRSLRFLLQGELLLAFKMNPLMLVAFPLIALMMLSRLLDVLMRTEIYDRFFRGTLSTTGLSLLGIGALLLYLLKLYIGLA